MSAPVIEVGFGFASSAIISFCGPAVGPHIPQADGFNGEAQYKKILESAKAYAEDAFTKHHMIKHSIHDLRRYEDPSGPRALVEVSSPYDGWPEAFAGFRAMKSDESQRFGVAAGTLLVDWMMMQFRSSSRLRDVLGDLILMLVRICGGEKVHNNTEIRLPQHWPDVLILMPENPEHEVWTQLWMEWLELVGVTELRRADHYGREYHVLSCRSMHGRRVLNRNVSEKQ